MHPGNIGFKQINPPRYPDKVTQTKAAGGIWNFTQTAASGAYAHRTNTNANTENIQSYQACGRKQQENTTNKA